MNDFEENDVLKILSETQNALEKVKQLLINRYEIHSVYFKKAFSDRIIDVVCQGEEISRFELLDSARKRENVNARVFVAKLLKEYTSFSLKQIGVKINRKHPTVIHCLHTFDDLYSTDKFFKERYEKYQREIVFIRDKKSDREKSPVRGTVENVQC